MGGDGVPHPGTPSRALGYWGAGLFDAGVVVSRRNTVVFHPAFLAGATLGFYALYMIPGFGGYARGMVLAIYAGAIWTTLLNLVGQSGGKCGRVVFLAV